MSNGVNVYELTVTKSELARICGVSAPAITQARWPVVAPNGECYLVRSLQARMNWLGGQADELERGGSPAADLDAELTRWRIQTEKRKDAEWREAELRQMGEALLLNLRDDFSRLRELIGARPDCAEIVSLIDQVRSDIEGMEPDDIVSEEDGDEE